MNDQTDLARRAVACQRWRWMPGMLAVEWAAPGMGLTGGRPMRVDADWQEVGVYLPDLTDPATLGCLLALVREAWGDPEAHLALGGGGWVLMSGESRVADVVYPSPAGRTEAAALVAALEAAP